MKFQQLFAWLIRAAHAVFNTPGDSALPDRTDVAIADKPLAVAFAAVAVDILRLKMMPELFRSQCRCFLPGYIIIFLSGQKGGAAGTNHFRHDLYSFFSGGSMLFRHHQKLIVNLPTAHFEQQEPVLCEVEGICLA